MNKYVINYIDTVAGKTLSESTIVYAYTEEGALKTLKSCLGDIIINSINVCQ